MSTLRIGEVARLCGVTTRTLRLLGGDRPAGAERAAPRPSASTPGTEVERAGSDRELQAHMGFSLAEIRVALETEDVLDKLRTAYKANARPELQRDLLGNAIAANDDLVARLDETLLRVNVFRRTSVWPRRNGCATVPQSSTTRSSTPPVNVDDRQSLTWTTEPP